MTPSFRIPDNASGFVLVVFSDKWPLPQQLPNRQTTIPELRRLETRFGDNALLDGAPRCRTEARLSTLIHRIWPHVRLRERWTAIRAARLGSVVALIPERRNGAQERSFGTAQDPVDELPDSIKGTQVVAESGCTRCAPGERVHRVFCFTESEFQQQLS